MKHIDLFSGIGGFALSAKMVWGGAYKNVLFCDNNRFCQEVIKKNFGKDSVIYGDIREVTSDATDARVKGVRERKDEVSKIDILTGGFPCQPFSHAGKRRGKEDDRYLWPEMLRVIKEFKPRWVVGENVAGIVNMALEQVCLDLEAQGYEVQPVIIPACAVNAPHRRDRVWIIAHSASSFRRPEHGEQSEERSEVHERSDGNGDASDTKSGRHRGSPGQERTAQKRELEQGEQGRGETRNKNERRFDDSWFEVATELCGVDDGLSAELDGFKLTKAGHRVERLKALGNAIVPQIVVEIFRAIRECDHINSRG